MSGQGPSPPAKRLEPQGLRIVPAALRHRNADVGQWLVGCLPSSSRRVRFPPSAPFATSRPAFGFRRGHWVFTPGRWDRHPYAGPFRGDRRRGVGPLKPDGQRSTRWPPANSLGPRRAHRSHKAAVCGSTPRRATISRAGIVQRQNARLWPSKRRIVPFCLYQIRTGERGARGCLQNSLQWDRHLPPVPIARSPTA